MSEPRPVKASSMQAIVTKYLSATDTRGSRVSAKCQAGSLTISWDDALDTAGNHEAAAAALANGRGWLDSGLLLIGGALPSGDGYAFTFYDTRSSLVDDWRGAAIDALIDKRYADAVTIIKNEGAYPSTDWSTDVGKITFRGATELFTRSAPLATSSNRRKDAEAIAKKIVDLLNEARVDPRKL